jgi:hypothetical protein
MVRDRRAVRRDRRAHREKLGDRGAPGIGGTLIKTAVRQAGSISFDQLPADLPMVAETRVEKIGRGRQTKIWAMLASDGRAGGYWFAHNLWAPAALAPAGT